MADAAWSRNVVQELADHIVRGLGALLPHGESLHPLPVFPLPNEPRGVRSAG